MGPASGAGWAIERARTRRARRRGLLGRPGLAPRTALLLTPCRSVHTVGMRFTIDCVWLDGRGRVLRVDAGVRPGRLRWCPRAGAVLECAAGGGAELAASVPSLADG